LGAKSLTFSIGFHDDVSPPSAFAADSVVGYIDIDVDQNALTGAKSNRSRFRPAIDSGLAIEFYVDLFSERFSPGMAEVVDAATMQVAGLASTRFAASGLEVEVPLTFIGNDGLVNYGIIVGDFLDMSDEVRNAGETVAYSVPEPGGPAFVILALLGLIPRRHAFGRRPIVSFTKRFGP
jgi:hypothetical protein